MLVLVPAGFDTASLRKDQVVVVSGKVRPYVMAELEKDFDWFKNGKIVTTGKKVDYETRPVLWRTASAPSTTATCSPRAKSVPGSPGHRAPGLVSARR